MDAKLLCLIVLAVLGISSITDARPTCPEPTCGGTRQAGAPPEGEGGEEEKADPCAKDPRAAWYNFYAWGVFCEDGTIGAYKEENPPGKIGTPTEEEKKSFFALLY